MLVHVTLTREQDEAYVVVLTEGERYSEGLGLLFMSRRERYQTE